MFLPCNTHSSVRCQGSRTEFRPWAVNLEPESHPGQRPEFNRDPAVPIPDEEEADDTLPRPGLRLEPLGLWR